ncbi:MAG: DegT/DnrJ/EryC1/StrS family aminotransferase [Haloferula sp.]
MKPRRLSVTLPFLPPLGDYAGMLEGVWERNQLTNQGPLAQKLEEEIAAKLGIDHPVHTVANGGLGIQIALKALGIKGKVITSPFSYVATTSCPVWGGNTPVFADIEEDSLGINPASVEASIDSDCEAILATHVFGNACDVAALEKIASHHGLALIFDSAHAFGSRYLERSLVDYGDISIVSTHATKVFHTVEGGFVTGRDREALEKVEWMRRFGHDGDEQFHGIAINAKMSELHAAMGLAMMPHFEEVLQARASICDRYLAALQNLDTHSPAMKLRDGLEWNHAYFPVLFESEPALCERLLAMNNAGVYPRRYFHPSLDQALGISAPYPLPVSHDISSRILCLPLHHQMTVDDADLVIELLTASPRS